MSKFKPAADWQDYVVWSQSSL